MAANEGDIIRDQQERDSLLRSIASAEAALAASAPSTRRVLESMIEGVKGRVAMLDTKIKDEREAQVREQAAVAIKAQKEAALSAGERAEYSGFLKEDFFTKRDFGRLDHFYAGAWDRLSQDGKEEMSHRVWEGIRHDEYRFTDLPRHVRDKEEDFIYAKISNPAKLHDGIEQIPESERADFIRAYDAGDRETAGKVLNRGIFRKSTSLSTSTGVKRETADEGRQIDNQAAVENVRSGGRAEVKPSAESSASTPLQDIQLDAANLKSVALLDATSPPSAASLPDASGSRVNRRG